MKRDLIVVPVLFALVGCAVLAPSPPVAASPLGPDPDAIRLVAMSEQALSLAQRQTPDAVLHQIDTDLRQTTFLFTDRAAMHEISVNVAAPETPPEQWTIRDDGLTPLVGNTSPGLRLDRLRAGPERVGRALTAHWPGCMVRGLNLYSEDDHLTWVAFCTTPAGIVSGTIDAETGLFQPSNAPSGPLPITATPRP